MIFGKTDAEKSRSRERFKQWHEVFAWWPIKLIDGRWAWFHCVERIDYLSDVIDFNSHANVNFFTDNVWCYREIPNG